MINKILKFAMVIIIALMVYTVTSYAFTMNASLSRPSVKVGEEVTYTIKLDEKVVATNFNVNYDSNTFDLVRSNTTGLNVAEKDGKIACIYADMGGVGTDTFEIILKAKKSKNAVSFSVEGAKFRAVNASTSYVGNQIVGIETSIKTDVIDNSVVENKVNDIANDIVNSVETNVIIPVNNIIINANTETKTNVVRPTNSVNTTDKTTSKENIPQTGESDLIIKLLVLSTLLIVVNKIRIDRLKDVK